MSLNKTSWVLIILTVLAVILLANSVHAGEPIKKEIFCKGANLDYGTIIRAGRVVPGNYWIDDEYDVYFQDKDYFTIARLELRGDTCKVLDVRRLSLRGMKNEY